VRTECGFVWILFCGEKEGNETKTNFEPFFRRLFLIFSN